MLYTSHQFSLVIGSILFSITGAIANPTTQAAPCAFPKSPTVLKQTSRQTSLLWQFSSNQFDEQGDPSELRSLQEFRSYVSRQVDPDPYALLDRQRTIYARAMGEKSRELTLFNDIISQRRGKIEPIGCLESLLMSELFAYFPGDKGLREFAAYVLQRGRRSGSETKVYFLTGEIGSVSTPPDVTALINLDRRQGWEYTVHLHNHIFFLDNPAIDIAGTTIPSDPDLSFYQRERITRGLRAAWITNGFSTLKLRSDEF